MITITKTNELVEFCQSVKGTPFVTVDTEFMRESTYWPQLCLVQVAGPDDAVAIDALAPGIDLAPLFDLMDAPETLKVFHAARQDVEIFYHLMGHIPAPLFDTQVAAMVCGFGDQVGYENLIAKLTKARVDKSSRFTDWSRRPLSDKQIAYALSDVTHLRDAYRKLSKELQENGRSSWLESEMQILTSVSTYEGNPDLAYKRIKARNPKPRVAAVLKELAAWREREAQRRDMPRNRILRDDALMEIAHHAPKTANDLARTRGLGDRMANGPGGVEILKAVERGLAIPESDLPKQVKELELPSGIGPVSDLLKVFLKMICEETGVAQKLIANSSDIDHIAAFGKDAKVDAMSGWRYEMFGEAAVKLRSGEMGLAIKNKKVILLENTSGD
ncbi:ribonuclease D [Magnetovibrio blakemorei]|uniref:Ribonuclease D n=1 Tax=Magnetovibrio blakemorei TaxID=28181 RepID=A0A1E5Q5N1_9PROT|nr:ribonuclease D [Magnetovibrio blakemorei]OEJ65570.1 ribonuclease D [Magnetovibrio blakemorei]